jgi:hypothetical protein
MGFKPMLKPRLVGRKLVLTLMTRKSLIATEVKGRIFRDDHRRTALAWVNMVIVGQVRHYFSSVFCLLLIAALTNGAGIRMRGSKFFIGFGRSNDIAATGY